MAEVYQFITADKEENKDKIDEVRKKAVRKSLASISALFMNDLVGDAGAAQPLLHGSEAHKRFSDALRCFFNEHDRDRSGSLRKSI